MKQIFILIISTFTIVAVAAKGLQKDVVNSLDRMMEEGVKQGYYPGASLVVGDRKGVLYEKCFGWQDTSRVAPVTFDDVYDVASLTKIVATTFAVMRLYDEGDISLNKTIGDYIDYYDGTPIAKIPLSQLLTHTSGLPYFPAYPLLYENATGEKLTNPKPDSLLYPLEVDRSCYLCAAPIAKEVYVSKEWVEGYRSAADSLYVNPEIDSLINTKIKASYRADRRGRYRYSDTNFYILRQIVEAVTGDRFDYFTRDLFEEMDMYDTGFIPLEWKLPEMIIPTEYDYMLQRGMLRGYVHDDLSASNGGVEGNAGLFSNARDLAKFCEMMLGNGVYKGKRILSRNVIKLFTSQPLIPRKIYRGLGFDKRSPDNPLYNGYGHTGYTGTMIWIDPELDIYMVFLSNRVHPSRLNNSLIVSGLRTRIWEVLKSAKQSGL